MDIRPVCFFDSGVGGLPYCQEFLSIAPGESLIYVADRAHFPYGPRPREEISLLVQNAVRTVRERFDPKLVAIVCNSASVSALDDVREIWPEIPFVGTVPAIKTAASHSSLRKIGLIATERTVADPYIQSLKSRFAPDCQLEAIAAPELVHFVERDFLLSSAEERLQVVRPFVKTFRERGVDAIILACTHFLFLAPEFIELCGDSIAVFDSRRGVASRIQSVLAEHDLLAPSSSVGSRLLYVTGKGPFERSWQDFAARFGFAFSLSLEAGQ